MGKFTRVFLGVAAAVVMATAPVSAKMTSSMEAADIEKLLRQAGFNPNVVMDATNNTPVAVAKAGNVEFVVRALDCDGEPVACERLLLLANFSLGRQISALDYRVINSFNETKADGRAYVLEKSGEIGVDYMIDLTGGVSPDHISSRLDRWQGVIEDFINQVRSANSGS